MKRKRMVFLSTALGILVTISTIGSIRTAKAECSCVCYMTSCSTHTCYSEFSGDSVSSCITCVAGCCAAADKASCPPPAD